MPSQSLSSDYFWKKKILPVFSMSMMQNISLVTWGQLSRLYSLPASHPPPTYLLQGWNEEQRWPRHCTKTVQQSLKPWCYQQCFGHKSKGQNCMGCCEENSLHPKQTPHSCSHSVGAFWQSQSCSIALKTPVLKARISFFPCLFSFVLHTHSLTFTTSEAELIMNWNHLCYIDLWFIFCFYALHTSTGKEKRPFQT